MGSMSFSSCRCCMFVSGVHPVAVLNVCILHDLQFVNAGRGCKRCVAMRSAVLFIFRSRLLLYFAGSGVNRVQVVFV